MLGSDVEIKNMLSFLTVTSAVPAAVGEQEEAGGGRGGHGGSGGDEEEAPEGPGAGRAASGGEDPRLRQDGEDKDPPAAGAGRPHRGPGPPEADRQLPGEEAEEVRPGRYNHIYIYIFNINTFKCAIH